ncbi:hypothetical protein Lal_00033820 [Lupinus albus]|nr:hypothetical protein Lal_00033820 [Lupinus albus]
MVIDIYFQLHLPLSNEKLKKHESVFSTMFEHMSTCLLSALSTKLPQWCNANSVYCIRHIASSFNKEFKHTDLKEKVMKMGMY